MKLWVMSDLHFEFHPDGGKRFLDTLPDVDHDVAIIAGDLSDFHHLPQSLQRVGQRFRRVLYVTGNHESYSRGQATIDDALRVADQAAPKNVTLLECSTVTLDGQRFVGGTLWFPYEGALGTEHYMNDFHQIKSLRDRVGDRNLETRRYLERNVEPRDVVITHHLPGPCAVHAKYARNALNSYFVGGAEHVCEQKPALWVFGHTHTPMRFRHGATDMICNPLGYPHENPAFNPSLVIEI